MQKYRETTTHKHIGDIKKRDSSTQSLQLNKIYNGDIYLYNVEFFLESVR